MTKRKIPSVARDIVESEIGMFDGYTAFTEAEIADMLNRLFGEEGKDETDQEPVQPSETE